MSGRLNGCKRMHAGVYVPLFAPLSGALEILEAAWSGELVRHRGEHYTVDAMRRGRNPDEPFEVIAELEPGVDPAPYRKAEATWLLVAPDWEGISVDGVRGVIREAPAHREMQGTGWRSS
jgi:hypothetical protein